MGEVIQTAVTILPSVSMTVDRDSIMAYAEITADYNPLHVDDAFAAATPFGRPIAHGMLSLNLIWQSLRQAFGSRLPISLEIRFVRPVLRGTRVAAGGGRRAEGEGYDVWVRDESGQDVIVGVATLEAADRAPT